MFKIERKEYDRLGNLVVRGKAILERLPKKVVPFIVRGAQDQNLVWEKIFQDCTMYVSNRGECSLVHNVDQWPFSGKLLLTFNLDPKCNHRISFPKKWLHLDIYSKNNHYCH